jgi:hypothetical protein
VVYRKRRGIPLPFLDGQLPIKFEKRPDGHWPPSEGLCSTFHPGFIILEVLAG